MTKIFCEFQDCLGMKLNDITFYCKFSGTAAKNSTYLKFSTTDSNGKIELNLNPKIINETGTLYIDFFIITDTNMAKNSTSYKKIGKTQQVHLNKKNLFLVRSDWVKINFPLIADNSDESTCEGYDKGYYKIEYHKRNIIKGDHLSTVNVYLNGVPKKIIDTALKYRGSTLWAKTASKTSIHPHLSAEHKKWTVNNGWKCNQFVNDILTEVSSDLAPPWMERGKGKYIPLYQSKYGPPLAGEWADKNLLTARWGFYTTPMPGDIGSYSANYEDATGHTGFIIATGVTISAGEHRILVNDAGFRSSINGESLFDAFRRHKIDK